MEVPRRLRKINKWPENGSAFSFSRHRLRDSINTLAAIDGFNRNQDADLRCDLDHEAASHNALLKPARSAAVAPFQ